MNQVLITGGCGFVGSNIALQLKLDYPQAQIVAMDNLKRRGSELNITRLSAAGIKVLHGDIRNTEDFNEIGKIDLLIEAAAEPSVLSGINSTPDYLLNTNLLGTINCMNFASKHKAKVVFLSTSRIYPIAALCKIKYSQTDTRFTINEQQDFEGISPKGVAENFPLNGARSFYGTSKLSSELLIHEYGEFYDVPYIINRCGVLTGPWQMGKIDQGVVVLWLAMHFWKKQLSYIGFGGQGKQVRDILHVQDLYDLVKIQLQDFDKYDKGTYNVGGGLQTSLSLQEMTALCEKITGNKISISNVAETRPADIPIYITDNTKITELSGWQPKRNAEQIFTEIFEWMQQNEQHIKNLLTT
jgi:CDP-paratose 2-epimerase